MDALDQIEELRGVLRERFGKHHERHGDLAWSDVEARLAASPEKWRVLLQMEATGGEPDVIDVDRATGEVVFCDCAAESPKGRRSLCYDRPAWEARKEAKPESTAVDVAAEIGIELLTEAEYHALQRLGPFDQKTSSWLRTPPEVRKLGGAIFGDFRYGRMFVFHNGADSYYASRGFRGSLRV
jgi:hypothetical protein